MSETIYIKHLSHFDESFIKQGKYACIYMRLNIPHTHSENYLIAIPGKSNATGSPQ